MRENSSVKYKIEAVRIVDDKEVSCRFVDEGRNLLMNAGLDYVATSSWVSGFNYFGTSTSAATLTKESSSILLTKTAGDITSDAAFFEASDVGKSIVLLGTNAEFVVTVYNSPTSVTVSETSTNVSATSGTVLYCTQTALPAEGGLERWSTLATNSGAHGYSWNGTTGVLSTWVTRLSTAATSNITIKALGWFNSSSGGTLMGIANINGGAGDTLLTGEQYRVKVQLDRKYDISEQSLTNPVTGWTANTTARIETIAAIVWDTSGNTYTIVGDSVNNTIEPYVTPTFFCTTSSQALRNAAITNLGIPSTIIYQAGMTRSSYVAGSRYYNYSVTLGPTDANSTSWRSFGMGWSQNSQLMFRCLLSVNCTKTSDDQLVLNFKKSWGRDLSAWL